MMLIIPALVGFIFAINHFSSQSSSDRINQIGQDLQDVAIIDETGLIDSSIVEQSGLKLHDPSEQDSLMASVKAGERSGLIVYPSDLPQTTTYDVYLSTADIGVMSAVQSTAGSLLRASVLAPLGSPEIIALAQTNTTANLTFYEEGEQTGGFNDYIVPGLITALFFMVISFSMSFMLVSISEEKENRSMEMVLTYVNPRDLVIGKIIGVTLVTITQILFFTALSAIAFLVLQSGDTAPALPLGIDLAQIPFDPAVIAVSLVILLLGFFVYAGLMIVVASMAPTAKEANGFSSVFIIGSIIPIYFSELIITDASNPIVGFLTYFPLTAPMTSLLRNTVGSLDIVSAIIVIIALAVYAIGSFYLAIKAFRAGSLEFAQSVKLSQLFRSQR